MAPHAYWSGYLRLSLVAVPIRLYSATTAKDRISLHFVDRETGKRVHYQTVIDDDTPVARDRVGKGYEYAKDQYLLLEDEDLKKLRLPTSKTLELESFVEKEAIDPLYFDKPFYVAPDGAIAAEAFDTIRAALAASQMVGVGRIAINGKERVGALQSIRDGMMLTTLRAPEEIRAAAEFYEPAAAKPHAATSEEAKLAEQLIRGRAGPFEPLRYPDRYQEALRELVDAKLAGRLPKAVAEPRGARVINLMDALKKSVAQAVKGGAKPVETSAKPAAKSKAGEPAKRRKSAA